MRRAHGFDPGGEPLMHPEIDKIVEGLVARRNTSTSAPMRCC
jgi:hypothetical protein